jgi:hypothetical protein
MHGQYHPAERCKRFISNLGGHFGPGSEGNRPTKYYVYGSAFPLFARKLENRAKPVGSDSKIIVINGLPMTRFLGSLGGGELEEARTSGDDGAVDVVV